MTDRRFTRCNIHGKPTLKCSMDCEWSTEEKSNVTIKQATQHIDHELENWFTYHAPTPADQAKYEALRNKAKELAYLIREVTPKSADQTAALRKLRECMMTANASIACGGK